MSIFRIRYPEGKVMTEEERTEFNRSAENELVNVLIEYKVNFLNGYTLNPHPDGDKLLLEFWTDDVADAVQDILTGPVNGCPLEFSQLSFYIGEESKPVFAEY